MSDFRIVIDVSPVSFLKGRGYRRYILSLLNALRENESPNRYTFLSLDKAIEPFFPHEDPRFYLEHPRRRIPLLHRNSSWTKWLGKFLLSDVDVMHFPCTDTWYGPPRVPTVVTIHDLAPLHFPKHFFKTSKEERLYSFVLKKIEENADHVITGSNYTREEVLRYLDVEPERIRTVYNAVDPLFLKKGLGLEEEVKERGPNHSYFLFVGTLDFRKNIPLLLDAFSEYRARGGDLNLVLVGRQDPGNPTYYPPVEPLLKESKFQKHIFWLKDVSDLLLPEIYSKATALIFPSLFEGFGYPLVEAMACETPVVATRTSCLAEIAGEAAIMVEPAANDIAEAMIKIEADEPLRQRLKKSGKERLDCFLPSRLAREMIEVYHQVSLRKGFQSSRR